MPKDKTYGGYKNYQTYIIAGVLKTHYFYGNRKKEFVSTYSSKNPYKDFLSHLGLKNGARVGGVAFYSNELEYTALNRIMRDSVKGEA